MKFDLMLTTCELMGLEKFSYIPMLSPNDGTGNGDDIRYQFVRRRNLYEFLKEHAINSHRHIQNLRKFDWKEAGINYLPYSDNPYIDVENCRHSGVNRNGYFKGIPQEYLDDSLIFLDPDTGIEVKKMPIESEYVLYSDLRALSEKMSESSILAVFQWANHFVCSNDYFMKIARKILTHCSSVNHIDWIAKCPVGYIFISMKPDIKASIACVLSRHSNSWQGGFIVGSLSRTDDNWSELPITRLASPVTNNINHSFDSYTHTVHTDAGKEIDPNKARGRRTKDQWEQRPDASYKMQCKLCGKWLKSGIDAHVRSKQHEFSYKAYTELLRNGMLP